MPKVKKKKKGEIIMEKDKILNRWTEYLSELYEDHRRDFNLMKHNNVTYYER